MSDITRGIPARMLALQDVVGEVTPTTLKCPYNPTSHDTAIMSENRDKE
jgi:hypothetical protein